ncbi:MAG: hypothetical protein ACK4TP_00545 [Hyphomicrobium sp.]|jgi:hypothetical protein
MRKPCPLSASHAGRILSGALLAGLLAGPAAAQEWNPFATSNSAQREQAREAQRDPRSAAASDDIIRPTGDSSASAVERGDLAPVMAPDGSGLPYELWQGLNVSTLERLISEIDIPPRSPALHKLWLRLITSNLPPPDGGVTDQQFLALRLEILYRSGLLNEASRLLASQPASDPVVAILSARNAIGLGDKERGCEAMKTAGAAPARLPKPVKADAALISGYCAAIASDAAGAGLAAEIAREEGVKEGLGLSALDAISMGVAPQTTAGRPIALIDYRLIQAAGGAIDGKQLRKQASPALLAALALDAQARAAERLAAAEAAAEVNAITPQQLADIYRAHAEGNAVISDAAGTDSPERRAALFVAAENEHTPQKKVRMLRSFLDEAHRAGFYLTALRMVAPASETIVAAPEIGWYAETGVEVALAAGSFGKAREWAAFGSAPNGAAGASLNHWLALIDIAEGAKSSGEEDLRHVEDLALRGRMDATLLHRLATVLDALQYNVPIPLWEAASKTPQPTGGHLPETGVLTELQDAAKRRQFGRTVLLAMKTLGPSGAEGAHMIALGDSIRALRRAGLDDDAHNLGFEALFASWPRAISN